MVATQRKVINRMEYMMQVITTDWDGSLILVEGEFDEAGALRYSAQWASFFPTT